MHTISIDPKIERRITLTEGEYFVVSKGVEHKPEAIQEVLVMIFEPKTTEHTGSVKSDLVTVDVEVRNGLRLSAQLKRAIQSHLPE